MGKEFEAKPMQLMADVGAKIEFLMRRWIVVRWLLEDSPRASRL